MLGDIEALDLILLAHAQRVEREPPKYPLAVGESPRVPPEPRLQRFPREDIMKLRIGEEAALHQYGWVDRNAGIVRIPIDEAMKLTLERGLPARPQDPAQIAEADTLPADSSAGRNGPVTRSMSAMVRIYMMTVTGYDAAGSDRAAVGRAAGGLLLTGEDGLERLAGEVLEAGEIDDAVELGLHLPFDSRKLEQLRR